MVYNKYMYTDFLIVSSGCNVYLQIDSMLERAKGTLRQRLTDNIK